MEYLSTEKQSQRIRTATLGCMEYNSGTQVTYRKILGVQIQIPHYQYSREMCALLSATKVLLTSVSKTTENM